MTPNWPSAVPVAPPPDVGNPAESLRQLLRLARRELIRDRAALDDYESKLMAAFACSEVELGRPVPDIARVRQCISAAEGYGGVNSDQVHALLPAIKQTFAALLAD